MVYISESIATLTFYTKKDPQAKYFKAFRREVSSLICRLRSRGKVILMIKLRSVYKELHADRETGC